MLWDISKREAGEENIEFNSANLCLYYRHESIDNAMDVLDIGHFFETVGKCSEEICSIDVSGSHKQSINVSA